MNIDKTSIIEMADAKVPLLSNEEHKVPTKGHLNITVFLILILAKGRKTE